MWDQWGSCSDFNTPQDYLSFATAAAQKFDANVSALRGWRHYLQRMQRWWLAATVPDAWR